MHKDVITWSVIVIYLHNKIAWWPFYRTEYSCFGSVSAIVIGVGVMVFLHDSLYIILLSSFQADVASHDTAMYKMAPVG